MPRRLVLISLSLLAVLAGGCESYDRPRRPLPEGFAMQVLDGGRLDADGTVVVAASGPRSGKFLAARARELLKRSQ